MTEREKYQCPDCKSKDTKAVKAIYWQNYEIEEKETTTDAASLSKSPSYTKGTEKSIARKRSLLVEHCAPPKQPVPYPLIYVMMASVFLTFALFSYLSFKIDYVFYLPVCIIIFSILNWPLWYFMKDRIRVDAIEHMKKSKEWESTWYCPRCGTRWVEV